MDILFANQSMSAAGGFFGTIIPFLLMFLIMYFIVIRPQTKKQKEFDLMINNLKKGDRILTRGGIYGVIVDFVGTEKQKLLIDAGNNVKLHISKSYVAMLIEKENKKNNS